MGKTSQTEQKVKLPPEIKAQALANLDLAKQVGQLPYAPNFGLQVAGFTPQQQNAFASTNDAASAFGLPSGGGTGLPTPQNVGGFSGYSTRDLYNNMVSQVPPSVMALYNAFFGPKQSAVSTASPTSGASRSNVDPQRSNPFSSPSMAGKKGGGGNSYNG